MGFGYVEAPMTDQTPELVLASSSPRRRKLLCYLGIPFTILDPAVEEVPRPGEPPRDFALRAACDKADAAQADAYLAARGHGRVVILSADTVVVIHRRILGKPRSAAEAVEMLRCLSGNTHEVITAVCLRGLDHGRTWKQKCFAVETSVSFRDLSEEEIQAYVTSGEPLDKAGAYAAQGLGSSLIASVKGSYTNVVGLPLAEVAMNLKKFGLQPLPRRVEATSPRIP